MLRKDGWAGSAGKSEADGVSGFDLVTRGLFDDYDESDSIVTCLDNAAVDGVDCLRLPVLQLRELAYRSSVGDCTTGFAKSYSVDYLG